MPELNEHANDHIEFLQRAASQNECVDAEKGEAQLGRDSIPGSPFDSVDEYIATSSVNDGTMPNSINSPYIRRMRFKDWVSKRKGRIAFGLAGASVTATLINNPLSELKDDVIEAAPWVAAGVGISEAAFCVGAAMMIAAVGDKIGNPLKLKNKVPSIAEKANNSKMFKAGFWINAGGAVGDFAVISTGVLAQLPKESYPTLSLTLLDLGATIAVRKAILSGIENNAGSSQSFLTTEEKGV